MTTALPPDVTAVTADGWNHNAHYHDRLRRAVPRPCGRALDVGCGTGAFARQLAQVATDVDAIDRDSAVIARAQALSSGVRNVRFIPADFLSWPGDGPYDCITMVATLHHLPFADALRRAEGLLRVGGTLAVLGLDRPRSFVDAAARAAVAFPLSAWHRLTRGMSPVSASLRDPEMTLADVRRQTRHLLPGATVERLVLWRYLLIWTRRA